MIIKFTSPDYDLTLPDGTPAVTVYQVIACEASSPNPNTPYAIALIDRSLVSPVGAGVFMAELPNFNPSINNKNIVVFMRETNPATNNAGTFGSPSPFFYGGNPVLGVTDVISVE